MVTTKFGVFSEPTYLGHGDPYLKTALTKQEVAERQEQLPARDRGLNLKAPTQKPGKGNDATFGRFKPVFEGEKFIDPSRQALQEKSKQKERQLNDTPFKCTSPTRKHSGVGDFYGSLGGKIQYMVKQGPPPEVGKVSVEAKPNIYTNPAKKGSYGFNKTTLSEHQHGAAGVVGEYMYKADPYNLLVERRRAETEANRKAQVTDSPFKPANPPKFGRTGYSSRTLAPKSTGICGEYEYQPLGASKETKPLVPAGDPFRIAGNPKTGRHATLQKFPRYEADPEGIKLEARREAKKSGRAKLAAHDPWKYNSMPKSDMTRSIMRMNV